MTSPTKPPPRIAEPLEALRAILPAQAFSESALKELLPRSSLMEFAAGTALIREGEASDNQVYFLLSGSVSVTIQDRFILRLQKRGDSIGEMGLISAAPRSATVTTDEAAQFLVIDATLPEQPDDPDSYRVRYYLGSLFNSVLTEKLRTTSDRARMYEDMVMHSEQVEQQRASLEGEIAAYLQQISMYSHVVDGANDAILIADTEGRILNANHALQSVFDIPTDSVLGVEVAALLCMPDGGSGDWGQISRAAGGGGWHGEVVINHPTLGALPADGSVSAVHDAGAVLIAYSVILRDIRERKALEAETQRQAAELEQAYGQLQELDRVKSNFLSMVSHELRTPITSILAYSELLKTEGMVEPEDQLSFIEVIHTETEKLSEMVNKVLAISKLQSGEMMLDLAQGDLVAAVRNSAAALRSNAELKQVGLEVTVTGDIPPVDFDEDNLHEAVSQLLDNAIKHTEQGRIDVELRQENGMVLIRVADTGTGIEGLEIDSLLDTFGKGEAGNLGRHGLGLGLPLCYLVVKAHSGTLRLASRREGGTEAVIALPARAQTTTSRT